MDDCEENMSSEDIKPDISLLGKPKPRKRSLVERELETSLTARVTSPITNAEASSTSRYGRARKIKIDPNVIDVEKFVPKIEKSPTCEKTPVKIQSPVYRMHASNSPMKRSESSKVTPNKAAPIETNLENQIENIYHENISLSRFGSEEKKVTLNKTPKVYVRKDLIQNRDPEESLTLIKNLFSPGNSANKSNPLLNNILERSSEKYELSTQSKQNGYASVVKTLDFDNKKKKKDIEGKMLSKSVLFEMEAKCEYQVGDLAWSRMGTYPFWPCIVTREPMTGMFVKKKLFGRIERDMVHVTFFGDNGRRSWIVDTMLRKFHGQLEFEATREQFTPADKKKDPRLYAAFFISEKKQPQWSVSVEEAELLLREPKRLRIDILNDMLLKGRAPKTTPNQNKSGKIYRTASDVSLSESLYDTLFSEDDGKEDSYRSRNKSRNKSLDVSEVVTACLDNMAAKTGNIKIQRQSHMDKWLQKAKSKTPEKSQGRVQIVPQKVENKETKSSAKKKKKSPKPALPLTEKPYSFRRSAKESQNSLAHVDHDYSTNLVFAPSLNSTLNYENDSSDEIMNIEKLRSGIGVIAKVESLSDSANENMMNHESDGDHLLPDEATNSTPGIVDLQINGGNSSLIKIKSEDEVVSESIATISSIESNENVEKIMNTDVSENKKIDTSSNNDNINAIENDSLPLVPQEKAVTCEEESELFNNLVNGDVSDHIITETNDKNLESLESVMESSQEINVNGFLETFKESYTDPAFIKYLELRQDDIMDQHPELNQDEIVEYLHKTWLYEGNSDNIKQSDLGKGFKESKSKPKKKQLKLRKRKHNKSIDYDEQIQKQELDKVKENNKVRNPIINVSSEIPNETDKSNSKSDILLEITKTYKEIITSIDEKNKSISNDLSNEINTHEIVTKQYVTENETDMNTLDKNFTGNTSKSKDEILQGGIVSDNKLNENGEIESMDVSFNDDKLQEKEFDEAVTKIEDCKTHNTIYKNGTIESMDVLLNEDKLQEKVIDEAITKIKDFKTDSKFYEKSEVESMDVSKDEFKEKKPKIEGSKTNDKFLPNSNFVELCVSEQSEEIVIITNKEQNIQETDSEVIKDNMSSLPQYIFDDDTSCDSIDISYAISPLSVKGDDDDIINIPENEECKNNIPINELNKELTANGALENANVIENVDICKVNETDLSEKDITKEAGPKESVVLNEPEQILQDEPKSENTVPIENVETINSGNETTEDIKINGSHISKLIEDLEGDNSSIHSEDSEPLSVTKYKLKLKHKERVNKYADPDFVAYLEMRQDDLAEEHPELNQDEIVEYLHKTWLYEEDAKSDIRKTDDVELSSLVKGLGDPKLVKKRKIREVKEKKKEKKDTKENKDFETTSVNSEEKNSMKRWLRPKKYTSKLYADFNSSRDSSPAITDDTTETMSLNSLDSEDYRTNNSTPSDELSKPVNRINNKLVLKIKPLIVNITNESDKAPLNVQNSDKNIDSVEPLVHGMVNGFNETELIKKIKEENDLDTVSMKSEDSEVSVAKRKQKSKTDKTMDDPEFVKYLELRQDALIDENPQLSQKEIVGYLFKTWLYEESVKSDIKKTDEIEQSNLVKGLNQDIVIPKRVKKKIKVENDFEYEPTVKPKRKTVQPCYNEDYPDIEDEIAIFEIMKNSPTVELNKIDLSQLKLQNETKDVNENKDDKQKETIIEQEETTKDETIIEIADEIDEVELYFEQLTKPKPNIFKGQLREKVCEICEKIGNLVKCKGCNGMFHMDCVKNEIEVVDTKVSVPSRGRKKKKKKPGRKPKNLEDSGSMSDEKSQDVSAENMSIDETSHTFNAEDFEAQLSVKMKELLEAEKEIHYDSYSSDDGIDWDNSIAGKCEIVDVTLKRKSQSISDFKCNNCQKYETPVCFVCKLALSKTGIEYRQRCQVAHCHKYYHLECLDHWPQTQFTSSESRNKKTNEVFESHTCPRHVCHTCVSDDPRGCKTRFSGDKLARCVRCPATYHSFTKCLPAGTQILTASHIICPRHYQHRPGKVPCHVNTGWCFICALGGTLICCEYCPTSFHAECLNISPPEGNYMCEDCETGRLPLYGEMVWVKLGHYRWWPGIILHPSEIPDNIMAVKHSLGEFVVRFFGQYDHYWVNRGRVFPFQEGDSGRISSQKSKIDAAFTTAMEHAQRACQILKHAHDNEEESTNIASSLLPPHYVKLKVNKPCGSLINRKIDIEESSLTQCECDPNDQDPCGPYSQCLNRMLLTECGPICRAGDRCNNRAFEKRLYPKLVPYRTPHRGWGLKTLEPIKAGQFVIEYVGELIDEDEFRRRMARMHEIRDENFYFLTLDKERMIDAGPKGNLARFMNHCCEPNCETQKWTVLGDVRVGLFAIHDIPANSEVTFNYLLECAGIDKKKCMCGTKRCAGYIGAKPKQDESQPKKSKVAAKRTYKKRKNTEESPSTKTKLKRPVGRPAKPKELTEIEKDLLIIKNATNGLSSDSECSRLSSLEGDRNSKALKRKRVSFSSEEVVLNGPSVKKVKVDEEKSIEAD